MFADGNGEREVPSRPDELYEPEEPGHPQRDDIARARHYGQTEPHRIHASGSDDNVLGPADQAPAPEVASEGLPQRFVAGGVAVAGEHGGRRAKGCASEPRQALVGHEGGRQDRAPRAAPSPDPQSGPRNRRTGGVTTRAPATAAARCARGRTCPSGAAPPPTPDAPARPAPRSPCSSNTPAAGAADARKEAGPPADTPGLGSGLRARWPTLRTAASANCTPDRTAPLHLFPIEPEP